MTGETINELDEKDINELKKIEKEIDMILENAKKYEMESDA